VSAVKTIIARDWLDEKSEPRKAVRKLASFEQLKVKSKADLPELITTKEAALLLKCHWRTIEEWRKDGALTFIKVMGRYFTTPEFIAHFIEAEIKKNG